MAYPENRKNRYRCALFILTALLLLLAAGAAAAERHTAVLKCGGGGFVGNDKDGKRFEVLLDPEETVASEDKRAWTLEELKQLPDFELQFAALRFTASFVEGTELRYTMKCGDSRSNPMRVRTGRNLWDVTDVFRIWMETPDEALRIAPTYDKGPRGIRTEDDSWSIQITFSTTAKLPDFRLDRVRDDVNYEASLGMLEASSVFIAMYDDTADSLMQASLKLGVPYYFAAGSEEKFLHRFFPTTTTNYYQDTHMYLCGLDCVGMTRLVYEKCGRERHPSIARLLMRGAGHEILTGNDPSKWPMFLQPGELIVVKHGSYHVMMYLGTMRQFGWKESNAGEAADLLDQPLVIHCGGNPFYYERYQKYIREMGYQNTYPPDGGVTVAVIRKTDRDAPHSTDTSWGKHFGWYEITADQPLMIFRLDDCTDIAWYAPEQNPYPVY